MGSLGKFDGYNLREIGEGDRAQLEEWIAGDRHHAGLLDPEFFMGLALDSGGELAPDPRVTVCAIEDSRRTLMYIRLTRASRVQIQFAPEHSTGRSIHVERRQMANALMKGMAFLEVALERAGAMEWIFDSRAAALRAIAQRRLGFVASPLELVRLIPRLDHPEAQSKPLRPVPQTKEVE